MKTKFVTVFFFSIFGFSGLLLAAEHGGGHGSLFSLEMLFKGINFLILLILLFKFARKPIANMLSKTAEDSKETLDTAREKLKAAKDQLKEYQAKLSNLELEMEDRRKAALESIEAEKRKIVEEAEQQAKKLEEQSKYRIEQDLAKAKAEIRAFIADESVKLAENIISNEIDDKDRKGLIKTYTDSLGKTA